MLISSSPRSTAERSKSTASTSMRGSQWSRASRTSASIWATVVASIVSNTKSCTPQPKSGRMGRSPLAVERIRWMAWSTSVWSDASAMPPRRSTWSGNAMPEPRISAITGSLSDVDDRALDGHAARPLDVHRRALELELAGGLDVHARRALDRDLAGALDLDRRAGLDVDLVLGLDAEVARAVTALDGHLHVLGGGDHELLLRLELGVLRRVDDPARAARPVLEHLVARRVLGVVERAEDDGAAGVAVLERDRDLVADLGQEHHPAVLARAGRRDPRPGALHPLAEGRVLDPHAPLPLRVVDVRDEADDEAVGAPLAVGLRPHDVGQRARVPAADREPGPVVAAAVDVGDRREHVLAVERRLEALDLDPAAGLDRGVALHDAVGLERAPGERVERALGERLRLIGGRDDPVGDQQLGGAEARALLARVRGGRRDRRRLAHGGRERLLGLRVIRCDRDAVVLLGGRHPRLERDRVLAPGERGCLAGAVAPLREVALAVGDADLAVVHAREALEEVQVRLHALLHERVDGRRVVDRPRLDARGLQHLAHDVRGRHVLEREAAPVALQAVRLVVGAERDERRGRRELDLRRDDLAL